MHGQCWLQFSRRSPRSQTWGDSICDISLWFAKRSSSSSSCSCCDERFSVITNRPCRTPSVTTAIKNTPQLRYSYFDTKRLPMVGRATPSHILRPNLYTERRANRNDIQLSVINDNTNIKQLLMTAAGNGYCWADWRAGSRASSYNEIWTAYVDWERRLKETTWEATLTILAPVVLPSTCVYSPSDIPLLAESWLRNGVLFTYRSLHKIPRRQ